MSQRMTCLSVMSMIGLIAITLAFLSLTRASAAPAEIVSCATVDAESDQGYGNISQPVEVACGSQALVSSAAVASR
jgi:hypothetical protein